ncbi:restriction endonuclease subunit S [Aeromonas sp. INTO2]|uniref:restriction endonuclease subunit S n=1 Tax=Aeromonas sp. INTO2 TaxID=3416714 RepID=UPI003CFA3D17
MSSDWEPTTLGSVCDRQGGSIQTGPFGSQLHASDYVEQGIPVVMPANIGSDGGISEDGIARITQFDADRLQQHKLQVGDVVFSRRGDVTRNALIEAHQAGWLCGTGCLKVRLGSQTQASAKFISYCLRLPETKDWLVRHAVGATMPNLNTSILSAVPILLPELTVQQSIANILGCLDEQIDLLRETNATLEAIAQALFKSWFVDFEPVHARARGEQPAGLAPEVAALFPDSLEESELGQVPMGWSTGSLNDLALLNPESWTVKNRPDSVAYVDLANAKENVIAEITEFLFEDAPSRARRVLRDGDTIVGTVRPGNRSYALISNPRPNLTGSTGFAVLRPKQKAATEYVYLAATANSSIEYLAHVADGGAYPAVRPEVVSNLPCVLPSYDVLNAFHAVAAPLFAKVAANHQQAQTLATLRDTLLPRLISGQLRLPDAEEQLSEAGLCQ